MSYPKFHHVFYSKRNILNKSKIMPESMYSKEIIELAKKFKEQWPELTKSLKFMSLIDENNVIEAEKLAKKILDKK